MLTFSVDLTSDLLASFLDPQRLASLEGGVKARDVELGRLARQLDRSKSSEAEVAAKNNQVVGHLQWWGNKCDEPQV